MADYEKRSLCRNKNHIAFQEVTLHTGLQLIRDYPFHHCRWSLPKKLHSPRGQMVVLCPRTVSLASIRPFRNALGQGAEPWCGGPRIGVRHYPPAKPTSEWKPTFSRKKNLQMVGFFHCLRVIEKDMAQSRCIGLLYKPFTNLPFLVSGPGILTRR